MSQTSTPLSFTRDLPCDPARRDALLLAIVGSGAAHAATGVFGAVSVAAACALPGSVAAGIVGAVCGGAASRTLDVEQPTGFFSVERAALLRTARLLMSGETFVPSAVWNGRVPDLALPARVGS